MKQVSRYVALWAGIATLFSTAMAGAEPLRFHAGASAAHAVGGHQQDELSIGGGVHAGAGLELMPELWLEAKAMGLWLTPGDRTTDPTIDAERGASLYGGAVGLTAYPFAIDEERASLSASGVWLSFAGGGAATGGRGRPLLDAALGWDAYWPAPDVTVGPALGWLHVFQPNSKVRPDDANVVMLGFNLRFWSKPPPAPRADRDADRDGDGVPDERDRCPHAAEDRDGFEDDDGCPDWDNDKDGILDSGDECPNEAEDRDGFDDGDGCPEPGPEPDGDNDGVADANDQCPGEAEDKDGFEDYDGCPDPDNDKDGIADGKDLCPNEPETVNDYADEDGCPDEDQVRVVGGEIILDEVVHFPTNSAVISEHSYGLLKRLAKLIREHPEYVHISIEGHADLRGPEAHNQKLSTARAKAVLEFLLENGVEAKRLSSKGFGSQRPVAPGEDARAFSENRRVEFVVTRAALPTKANDTTPKGKVKP